jgi:hypothetical protein
LTDPHDIIPQLETIERKLNSLISRTALFTPLIDAAALIQSAICKAQYGQRAVNSIVADLALAGHHVGFVKEETSDPSALDEVIALIASTIKGLVD